MGLTHSLRATGPPPQVQPPQDDGFAGLLVKQEAFKSDGVDRQVWSQTAGDSESKLNPKLNENA